MIHFCIILPSETTLLMKFKHCLLLGVIFASLLIGTLITLSMTAPHDEAIGMSKTLDQ